MRRLIDARLLVLGVLLFTLGCGSSGTDTQGEDGLTMALLGFSGTDIEQADFVGDTTAQVDICQDLCTSGDGGDVTVEPFTATLVNAVFVNRGKADIVLESFDINTPDSGVPPATRRISARLIGGRCAGDSFGDSCAVDLDCGILGNCLHTQTTVGILLYDFDFKQRVRRGDCPLSLEPLTLGTDLTFEGTDEVGKHRSVSASYVATYDNFDNCEEN